jgi:hypothetical protein
MFIRKLTVVHVLIFCGLVSGTSAAYRADNQRQTSVNVNITIEEQDQASDFGVLPIPSPFVPRLGPQGQTTLPSGFFTTEVREVELVTLTDTEPIPARTLRLACSDEILRLPARDPIPCLTDNPVIEFRPTWDVAPGYYRVRLVARTATGQKTLDLTTDVKPWVTYSVVDGNLAGGADHADIVAKVVVSSNALHWRLRWELVSQNGEPVPAGARIVPAHGSQRVRVADDEIIGGGAVEALSIELAARGVSERWVGFLRILGSSAR